MNRKYDFVIFGASGFTGQYVALQAAKDNNEFTFAIAGRSKRKLEKVLEMIRSELGENSVSIDILVADVFEEESMNRMCKDTRALLNCTGPYRYFGENTVKACVLNDTHYLDITGEPDFIERMMVNYDPKDSLVISACGFDSIPSDIGTVYTTNQYPKNVKPATVEAYIEVKDGKKAHFTTYECVVLGFSNLKELKQLRSMMPKVKVPMLGPKLNRKMVSYERKLGRYAVPFPGADASIVKNSQKYLTTKLNNQVQPVQFSVYYTTPSVFMLIALAIFGIVLKIMTMFEFTTKLLLKYPRIFTANVFSHEGPSQDDMKKATFSFTFFSKGYKMDNNHQVQVSNQSKPNWEVITSVSGPEPGYVATPIMLLESTYVVLRNEVQDKSGVLTTASAFRDTNLIQNLQTKGIFFKTIRNGPLV